MAEHRQLPLFPELDDPDHEAGARVLWALTGPTCKCGDRTQTKEPHHCPYKSEVYDDPDTCHCCETCQNECARDV